MSLTEHPSNGSQTGPGDWHARHAAEDVTLRGSAHIQHGFFEIVGTGDEFDLRPREHRTEPVPEEQQRVSVQVYDTRNILKLLMETNRLEQKAYSEFISRVTAAARAGCAADVVDPGLAMVALGQIREDILRRFGGRVVYRYLALLAGWAAAFALVAGAFAVIVPLKFPDSGLAPYGWVIAGAMVGAWLFAAARRREITFDDIKEFVDFGLEPAIRAFYVMVLAVVVAMMLKFKLIDLGVGEVDFREFTTSTSTALLLGFFAGIAERTLSLQIASRTQKGKSGAPSAST